MKIQPPHVNKLHTKAIVRSNDIIVRIKSPKTQKIKAAIFDLYGKKLAETDISLNEGSNIIQLPKPLVHGIYILRFNDVSEKIIL